MDANDRNSIQIVQNGQPLKAYAGCRFHRGGTVTGSVGNVLCFADVFVGDARDPRRGRTITPDDFGGPVTIVVRNATGDVVSHIGLATAAQVASHPNGAAAK